ncbi:sulfatase [Arenibacter sp. ARW7G5Y1]|uniref:sulfatase family protein n=1 Tax=Arenibacter sp. ARW7G5Y1 TaxID=2135619 RepID=UPI000D757C73|nr:sulfatase [Arenibacter sp. ARW7G5Y1]PXX31804.1 arylsulfatase A-like enzyme [Arenibacter sp. ARW7G5Y1]
MKLNKIFTLKDLMVLLILIGMTSNSYPQGKAKPNVLFLVIEDTSPYLFPAYGNTSIKTPNLDWLAKNGVVFNNAFANAPYCSPARSTLISGTQATVYGNDIHREGHIQKEPYFLVKKLTDAGYFTVNKGKMDYNITGKKTKEILKTVWSMNGDNASYNDPTRAAKPFFGQFNNVSTHMSRMTTITIDRRLKCEVDPGNVILPPHVPDLPEIRADYALHLEGVQNIDEWVGVFLDDLKERKLLENTIIFFFSDHGGCLPRGKAFPYDTGHRVPMIVYAPERYKNQLPVAIGGRSDRMVSFDDFIPTVLSLAGVKPPNYVTGKPFMGKYTEEAREYVYTFRTNTEMHFDPSRGVHDGEYHYIRNYTPHKIHALTQSFQWQMPAQLAWDKSYMAGNTSTSHNSYYEPHPTEALYNLKSDPWEQNNLAAEPAYQTKLAELREANNRYIRQVKDLGFLSWEERTALTQQGKDFYSWAREINYPLSDLISLAEKASDGKMEDLPIFLDNLKSDKSSFRFWGISGLAHLAQRGKLKAIPKEIRPLLDPNEDEDVSALAAEILVRMGEEERGLRFLLSKFKPMGFAISSLENLWDKTTPIENELISLATESQDEKTRLFARSLLIKQGKMGVGELYGQKQIDKNYKTYLNRVDNYLQNLPNTEVLDNGK